jgi:uncharacterized membrane protein
MRIKRPSNLPKKYSSPLLWLHYIPLLAIVYFFGVDLYINYIRTFVVSLGINIYQYVFLQIKLDDVLMTVWAFLILAFGDIFVHLMFGKFFGWKD